MAKKNPLDSAFKAFQDKKFDKAIKEFNALLKDDTMDICIRARLRQYESIASLANGKTDADSGEKTLAHVVVEMNQKAYDEAASLLDEVGVSDDIALYLKSEMAVEQGNLKEASELLSQAVDINRDNVGYAKNSKSFQGHLNDDHFAFLHKAES